MILNVTNQHYVEYQRLKGQLPQKSTSIITLSILNFILITKL